MLETTVYRQRHTVLDVRHEVRRVVNSFYFVFHAVDVLMFAVRQGRLPLITRLNKQWLVWLNFWIHFYISFNVPLLGHFCFSMVIYFLVLIRPSFLETHRPIATIYLVIGSCRSFDLSWSDSLPHPLKFWGPKIYLNLVFFSTQSQIAHLYSLLANLLQADDFLSVYEITMFSVPSDTNFSNFHCEVLHFCSQRSLRLGHFYAAYDVRCSALWTMQWQSD